MLIFRGVNMFTIFCEEILTTPWLSVTACINEKHQVHGVEKVDWTHNSIGRYVFDEQNASEVGQIEILIYILIY